MLSGERIIAYTHAQVAKACMWSWFGRGASDDIPVDDVSMGELDGPSDLFDIEFPPILLDALRACI